MSVESNTSNTPTPTSAIVEVEPQTDAMVQVEVEDESDEIKRETQALIEAIKQRARTEAQTAEEFTRETYLNVVRQLRESVEQNRLINPAEIEASAERLRLEAEKNWQALVHEMSDFNDRLSEAAKAAWDKLVHPHEPPGG